MHVSFFVCERFSCTPHDLLQAPSDFPPGHQDAAATTEALQSDVGAQAYDDPISTAAWMGFAKTQDIIHLQIGKHIVLRYGSGCDYNIGTLV